jgi:hypothetical protein
MYDKFARLSPDYQLSMMSQPQGLSCRWRVMPAMLALKTEGSASRAFPG